MKIQEYRNGVTEEVVPVQNHTAFFFSKPTLLPFYVTVI